MDASGRLTFPLIGTLEVAGKTPGEVSAMMADRFRGRFINDPQITVNLKEIFSQTVTIGGEVKKAGVYPIVGRMTLPLLLLPKAGRIFPERNSCAARSGARLCPLYIPGR